MTSNIEKYQEDLKSLINEGSLLLFSLERASIGPDKWKEKLSKAGYSDSKIEEIIKKLKPFAVGYHHWYSEALIVVKQLLPDRQADFMRLYERPKTRKTLDFETYRIEDACQGLETRRLNTVIVDMGAAILLLRQQIAIVESVEKRFKSSLFDIKQLVQADLYDSELDTAKALLKSGHLRAAGAIAGVVLEGHLKQVCDNHNLPKKSGTINALNDTLKGAGIIELSQSRQIQFLGDIRNNCSHKNSKDPEIEEVEDLIKGVEKIIKTLF